MQNQSAASQSPEKISPDEVPVQARRSSAPKEADTTTTTADEAVSKAAAGGKLSAEESSKALAWFLEEDQGQVNTLTFRLNVGIGERDRWIDWTVQALDRDVISQIRKRSERRGETDEMLASLRLAAAGTVDPPLTDPAVLGKFADPADALRDRFHFKPGLIDQIAAKVTQASGYDDDDVEDAAGSAEREVSAAQG